MEELIKALRDLESNEFITKIEIRSLFSLLIHEISSENIDAAIKELDA